MFLISFICFIFYCDTIILLSYNRDLKFCDANQLWSTTGRCYFIIVLVAVIFKCYYFMQSYSESKLFSELVGLNTKTNKD